jgi:DNA-binding NarL/FixJ family response regulator
MAGRINDCPARDNPNRPARPLTAAERAIVALVLRGFRNAEIARQRNTALSTVKQQLGSVYKKLGVTSRVGLILRELKAEKV